MLILDNFCRIQRSISKPIVVKWSCKFDDIQPTISLMEAMHSQSKQVSKIHLYSAIKSENSEALKTFGVVPDGNALWCHVVTVYVFIQMSIFRLSALWPMSMNHSCTVNRCSTISIIISYLSEYPGIITRHYFSPCLANAVKHVSMHAWRRPINANIHWYQKLSIVYR